MDAAEIEFWTALCWAIANVLCHQFRQDVAVTWLYSDDSPDQITLNLFCGTLIVEDDRLDGLIVTRHHAVDFLPVMNRQVITRFGNALRQYQANGRRQSETP